jgi:hypothetical protein
VAARDPVALSKIYSSARPWEVSAANELRATGINIGRASATFDHDLIEPRSIDSGADGHRRRAGRAAFARAGTCAAAALRPSGDGGARGLAGAGGAAPSARSNCSSRRVLRTAIAQANTMRLGVREAEQLAL